MENQPYNDSISSDLKRKSSPSPLPSNVPISHGSQPRNYHSDSRQEIAVRRSLEELSKDIQEIENFFTAAEAVIRQEAELDRLAKCNIAKPHKDSPNKENKTPCGTRARRASSQYSPSCVYRINSLKKRRSKVLSPRFLNSKLYFRNGRIGCLEAEQNASNIAGTHALVKRILQYENEKPLVSPESVRRVLCASNKDTDAPTAAALPSARVPLPGEILSDDDVVMGAAQNMEQKQQVRNETDLPANEASFDKCSQLVVDDDEQDVQICYNELPDILNDEKNLRTESDELVTNEVISAMESNAPDEERANTASSAESLDSQSQQFVREQVRNLVRRFTARANKVKSRLDMPPTPSSSTSTASSASENFPPSTPSPSKSKQAAGNKKANSTVSVSQPLQARAQNRQNLFEADTSRSNVWLCSTLCGSNNNEKTLDPQGKIYISWLCVVSLTFLYNAWVIPLRSTFPFQTKENTNMWLIADFSADVVYLLDVVFFKHRIMYLFEGFWVKDKNMTRRNYMRKLQFKLDLLALLPLELLYFKFGTGAVYLRFPRFFKIQSFWEVFKLLDRVISSPHFVRVAKTLTYMLYMIHLTACAYYAYSDYQGLGVNRWVFSGKGHPYVRCFAFATKTATSIGKNPKPEREGEYVFMTAAWLMGVFVFALLIGQIRDIISTATRNKNEYRQLEDETLEYMRRLNLPKAVQRRVKMWFKFTWEQQRTLDESNILDALPINLKTDIAISVHIQTLSKVQIFADCEEALLRDLVLKLRAVTFLPGDYVCRKGEVGREMYIIKLGQAQVMGGPNNDVVLATLSEGSVFGEISLLGINGADRRTADVCAKGYANLFVLSKSDLNEVIAYYPNAQAILKKRARTLMRKNAAREREEARAKVEIDADVVIRNPKTPETPPKLLQTVIQALPYESPAVMLITRGSKRMNKKRQSAQMETIEDREREDTFQTYDEPCHDNMQANPNKRSHSPDLLSSIQDELKNKNKFINLTDSQKALIISATSANTTHEPPSVNSMKQVGT